MRNTIIRLIYAAAVFAAAAFLFEIFLYRGTGSSLTGDMAEASLPVVTMETAGQEVNELYGLVSARDISKNRTVITPIAKDRKISFRITPGSEAVAGIAFELRSIDGSELIENGEVSDHTADDNGVIEASITIKDLIDADAEYMLMLSVTTESGKTASYYSRIMVTDTDAAEKELQFAQQFHKNAIAGTDKQAITEYIEPDAEQDNTSLEEVTINSSYDQVKYGSLAPAEELAPVTEIRDLQSETVMLRMSYILSAEIDGQKQYFDCTEYYRLRNGTDRVHLLDYDRTMQQVFDPGRESSYSDDVISLGITSSGLQMAESDGGSALAFVNAGRLYSCSTADETVSTVFAFAAPDSLDRRDNFGDSAIRILDVDETGSIHFLVYGYMNRGIHEGEIGTAVYSYSSEYKTVEELAFIPYAGSAELLEPQIRSMSFLNKGSRLFLLMDETLWQIDLSSRTATALQKNLTEGTYQVSSSGRMIAWKTDSSLMLMDCMNMKQQQIRADSGETVISLGFIEDDLIYGVTRNSDIITDPSGNELEPMYRVCVCDADQNILENYEMSGYYVTSCTVRDNQITLERMKKDENGTFTEAAADQILDSRTSSTGTNVLAARDSDDYGTLREIDMKGFKGSTVKQILPRMVLFEESRELKLPAVQASEDPRYFVYDMYAVSGYFADPSEAVQLAEEKNGNVIDGRGRYIWIKGNRKTSNQIMAITAVKDSGEGSIAACLNAVFAFENTAADAAPKLQAGKSMAEVLEETIPDAQALNLTGCSLDAVLYYVSEEKPVIAITDGGTKAVVITGYSDSEVVLMDPEAGTLSKIPREEAENMFTGTGDGYLAYLVLQ
jgi:hypothetical protein